MYNTTQTLKLLYATLQINYELIKNTAITLKKEVLGDHFVPKVITFIE